MKTLQEMTWMEFDKLRAETDIAIIPIGATEVYGPHLPLGTDFIVCEEVSKKVAQRVKCVIGPTITVGDSKCLMAFPGTLAAKPEHFEGQLEDITESLMYWGFKKFLFVNSHLTNVTMISHVCERLKDRGILTSQVDWWRFVQPRCEGVTDYSGVLANGHASEVGTSCMLYLREDLVVKEKITNYEPTYNEKYPDFIRYIDFTEMTNLGTIGMGASGSKEKGRKIVESCVDRIVDYLKDVYDAKDC